MAVDKPATRLLIVTGSTLRAEDLDRPLAYYLKQQIERRPGPENASDPAPKFRVHVVADFRWIHDEPLQALPTISIGGPGVNALSNRWLEEVPVSLAVDKEYYIQMDPDLDEPRASIWGMDNATTVIAISVFVERFLPRFLEHCAQGSYEIEPSEDDDDDDDDDE